MGRKAGERIFIDGGVVVTVVHVGRRTVRLKIEAPPDTKIVREELPEQGPRRPLAAEAACA